MRRAVSGSCETARMARPIREVLTNVDRTAASTISAAAINAGNPTNYPSTDIDGHARLTTVSGATIYYSNQYGGSFLNPATDNSVFGGVFFDITKQLTIVGAD